MLGVRTAVDANQPVVRVYLSRRAWWALLIWTSSTLLLAGAGALAWAGVTEVFFETDFWWFSVPFGAIGVGLSVILAVERMDPTPTVEIRPKRLTVRPPLGFWTVGRTVQVADVTRLWAHSDGENYEVRVSLKDGEQVRIGANYLAVGAVALERLIREATGLDVPGRPGEPKRAGASP